MTRIARRRMEDENVKHTGEDAGSERDPHERSE